MRKAENKRLPLQFRVYVFDDEQPLGNPKPYWLSVGLFNEKTDALAFIREKMKRDKYIQAMKLLMMDGTTVIFEREEEPEEINFLSDFYLKQAKLALDLPWGFWADADRTFKDVVTATCLATINEYERTKNG